MQNKRFAVVPTLLLIGLIVIPFVFAQSIDTTVHKHNLSEIITGDFIKKIEKSIGCKIEYVSGISNDYDNCGSEGDRGSCRYVFMERGKFADSSAAMLDFSIFKATNANEVEEKFNSERRMLVGWAITDKGDSPLPDEGYDLDVTGYSQVRKYDYGRRVTILARIDSWFFELDYDKQINDNKIIAVLEELGKEISFTNEKSTSSDKTSPQPIPGENQVKITDNLLTKDKEICSPSADDGTPYCNQLFGRGFVNDPKYAVIIHNLCPGSNETAQKIVIYNTLDNSIPPSGKSRVAYYCSALNQFWVSDYDSGKVPMHYWYGPFDGYPIKYVKRGLAPF